MFPIPRRSLRIALPLLACALSNASVAQSIWVAPWNAAQTTPASSLSNATGSFSADGELVLGINRFADTQLLRVTAAGDTRWTRGIASEGLLPNLVWPQADGSAVFANDGDGYLGKIAADGSVAWLSTQASLSFGATPTGNDRVLVGSCVANVARMAITAVDITNGAVAWQADPGAGCGGLTLSGDGQGGGYATTTTRLIRFTATGAAAWNVARPANNAALVGASDDLVYLNSTSGVVALHSSDGSPAWTFATPINVASNTNVPVWQLVGGELVASFSSGIARLDAANGTPRWTANVSNVLGLVSIDTRIVAVTTGVGLGVVRLDAASGAIQGTTTLSAAYIPLFALGRFGGTDVGVLAGDSGNLNATAPQIFRVNLASGAADQTVGVPLTPGNVSRSAVARAGSDLFEAGVLPQHGYWDVAIRKLHASDGNVDWQSIWHVEFGDFLYAFPSIATSNDAVFVVAPVAALSRCANIGVQARERASGAERWTTGLFDAGVGDCPQFSVPVVDAAGDVYVSGSAIVACSSPGAISCQRYRIVKLAAADGHPIWQREFNDAQAIAQVGQLPISMVGGELVAAGVFDTVPDGNRVVGLSLADGTPQWRSTPLSGGPVDFHPIDATHVLVQTVNQVHRVTTGSGTVNWSVALPACTGSCAEIASAVTSGGDLIMGGTSSIRTPRVVKVRGDGSGVDVWNPAMPDSTLRGSVLSVAPDQNGKVLLDLRRLWRTGGFNGFDSLAQFDPATMTLGTQQATSDYVLDAASGPSLTDIHDLTPTQVVLGGWAVSDRAGSVLTLANRQADADGDLAISVQSNRHSVGQGGLVSFKITVTYTGTAPISGARLQATFPVHQGFNALNCSGAGVSQCMVDGRSSNLRTSFDLTPGGTAVIAGTFRPVAGDESTLSGIRANVRGPMTLRETDTVNNLVREPILVGLFAGSFD